MTVVSRFLIWVQTSAHVKSLEFSYIWLFCYLAAPAAAAPAAAEKPKAEEKKKEEEEESDDDLGFGKFLFLCIHEDLCIPSFMYLMRFPDSIRYIPMITKLYVLAAELLSVETVTYEGSVSRCFLCGPVPINVLIFSFVCFQVCLINLCTCW